MKKLLTILLVGFTTTVSAVGVWEWDYVNVPQRSFVINIDGDSFVEVDRVRCTKVDGVDQLRIVRQGFLGSSMTTNDEPYQYTGKKVLTLRKQQPEVFQAYMRFCASVNRSN